MNDNLKKSLSGQAVKDLLRKIIKDLDSNPYINIDYDFDYKDGYPNYNNNQFKMDASIKFNDSDGEIWLIKTTNSIRTDRVKGNQFDAEHIKKLNDKVTKIFLVTSDFANAKEVYYRKKYSEKINNKQLYSVIDDVISLNNLNIKIREKALEKLSNGKRSNVLGNESEQMLVNSFNNEVNIEMWNKIRNNTSKSQDYEIFEEILITYGLDKENEIIKAITSTSEIPLLISRGQPKTDVSCRVITNVNEYEINMSVKQSNKKNVTVHEGFMEEMLDDLSIPKACGLGLALMRLQECGGQQNLKLKYPDDNELLENELYKYNNELIKYFVFGIGSKQTGIQVANMIVYTKSLKAFNIKEYIEYLNEYPGQFGTPFRFTYPSGGKGKKIQVKSPTNN